MSSGIVIQLIVWVAQFAEISFLGSDGRIASFLSQIALDFGVMRPSSRQQESEADYIGLLLMARSCYNPEKAVGLWERMEQANQKSPPEWLSTHPSNANRVRNIMEWLPKAESEREGAGCGMTGYQANEFQKVVGDFWMQRR